MKKLILAFMMLASAQVQAQTIKIDGSSTVFPITEAVAEDFQIANKKKIKVTVGISGTGGGFKKFCRGEIDISNASRVISKTEMEACAKSGIKYIEMPVALDALTVVVNSKNTWVKSLTLDELKKMWEPSSQNKITSWKQINPNFPDQKIVLYGPGSDSGTFDYFTEVIVGKAKASRGDYTASEDDNVLVRGVSSDLGGIGYFGYAYYFENKDKLRAVAIVNPKGQAVEPSAESVQNGSYVPLSRPIFIYVNAEALNRDEIKKFIEYYMTNAMGIIKEVKYMPLNKEQYEKNLKVVR